MKGFVLAVATFLLLGLIIAFSSTAASYEEGLPSLRISSLTLEVGGQGAAILEVLDVPPPGIDVWTIDIVYQSDVISAIECVRVEPSASCNVSHDEGVVRATGVSIHGLIGDTQLVAVFFECLNEGVGQVSLSASVLAEAEPGEVRPIENVTYLNGSVRCVEAIGPTATHEPDSTPAPTEVTGPTEPTVPLVAGPVLPNSGGGSVLPGNSPIWTLAGLFLIATALAVLAYAVRQIRRRPPSWLKFTRVGG